MAQEPQQLGPQVGTSAARVAAPPPPPFDERAPHRRELDAELAEALDRIKSREAKIQQRAEAAAEVMGLDRARGAAPGASGRPPIRSVDAASRLLPPCAVLPCVCIHAPVPCRAVWSAPGV